MEGNNNLYDRIEKKIRDIVNEGIEPEYLLLWEGYKTKMLYIAAMLPASSFRFEEAKRMLDMSIIWTQLPETVEVF